MMNFRKWVSCQLVSNKLLSARPFRFSDEEIRNEELGSQDTEDTVSMAGTASVSNSHFNNTQTTEFPATPHLVTAECSYLGEVNDDMKADPLTKVKELQIKFLRLVHRIGLAPENLVVSQVLYRLHLASLIRAGDSKVKRSVLKVNKARGIAAELEAAGRPDLDFSLKILVLGRTGVGKSATINSIFEQPMSATNAFHPATDCIQEIVGTIKGIKATVIDTPGLSPSHSSLRQNKKLLLSIKKFIRKSPPDVVLYFERLDVIDRGYSDYSLLKLITDVFGSSIWFNTIIVMTHSSSHPPEGSDGYAMAYDAFVHQCTTIVQHFVRQTVSSAQFETPVVLVENHPRCRTNGKGEKVLPNGQVWLSQFLLLCIATKVLADANLLLKFQDSFQLTPNSNQLPSLPHLLSSILRSRSRSLGSGNAFDYDADELVDNNEDDYDQLPPIRLLTRAQYQKLSKALRIAYLDELDYRETLYLKKQQKEELRRQRESMLHHNYSCASNYDQDDSAPQEVAQVLDMVFPLNFDADYPAHRFRSVLGNNQWLVRPLLDPQGWDHDVGLDGINLEGFQDVRSNLQASVVGQMRKDKEDLHIHSECTASYTDPKNCSLLAEVGIQTAAEDLVLTVHGDAKFCNLKHNTTGGGLSVTKYGSMFFVGGKLEDSLSIGRRCKLTLNAGQIRGCGQVASGGSIEATLTGKDYPVRDDKMTLATTILSFGKEAVLGGNIQTDFRAGRSLKMSVNADLNSRGFGQISVKTSTSEHMGIALIAIVSLFNALLQRKRYGALADEEI